MEGSTMTAPGATLSNIKDARQFADELQKRSRVETVLKQAVQEQVEEGILEPADGFGIISCITGQLYGFRWFHGDTSPADLSAALTQRAGQQTRY